MPTAKTKKTETARKTPAQLRAENAELKEELEKLKDGAYCYMCDTFKDKKHFYKSSDPNCLSGITPICKKCAYKIVYQMDRNGHTSEPTKASVMQALQYLDKPYLDDVWDSSYFESKRPGLHNDVWKSYIKNISMQQYNELRWKDSDIFKTNVSVGKLDAALPSSMEQELRQKELEAEQTIQETYAANKRDVIRIVGFDPFANYTKESDKPYLYGSLVSMIDEETKNDGMKMRAIIQIVQAHNQADKLDEAINSIVTDPERIFTDFTQAKNLADTKKKILDGANALAKDNGISVNYNNNKSKGANTLSGKVKMLTERGFDDIAINTFDIETSKGMLQVAELSEKARHEQIGYDDNIANEIHDIKLERVETLSRERDAALETARKLLDENNRIKAFLHDRGLINSKGQVIFDGA